MKFLLKLLPFLFVLSSNSYASSNERFHPSFEQYVSLGQIPGWTDQRKFGTNPSIDSATVPEDIWSLGGEYPFPVSAQTTTISSADADDTAGGDGCQELTINALNSSYDEIELIKDMTGTATSSLVTDLFRITNAFCSSSGSSGFNEGAISIFHGSTVIGHIPATKSRTQQAVYTVPRNKTWLIDTAYSSILRQQATSAVVEYQARLFGSNTWQTILTIGLVSQGSNIANASPRGERPFVAPQKTDIRIRVTSVSANGVEINTNISGFLVTGTSAL